jgi:creatinine amidohydrolase
MSNRDITLLTAEELQEEVKSTNGIIIPIASMEQCGKHGTTGIDVLIANSISTRLAETCNMLLAPTVPYGDTFEMQDFPGTVNIPTETLGQFYYAIALSYFKTGTKNIMFMMSHSLNMRAADQACRKLYSEGYNAFVVDFWKACSQVSKDLLEDKSYGTGHGSEQATSVSLAINEGLIKLKRIQNGEPLASLDSKVKHIFGSSNVATAYSNFHDYSIGGSWGDASKASKEKGQLIIDKAIALITESISDILKK